MSLRVALCQIDTTVGDLDGNRARCAEAAARAAEAGAELAVYPELAICGYPPRDLLDRPAFVADNTRALELLSLELPASLAALVGFVECRGDRLYNAVALLRDGRIEQVFHKRLLPAYDVFDEDRYFEPGALPLVFELGGTRFGVTICEDAWNDDGALGRFYDGNPVRDAVFEGAEVLINIAASPFTLRKRIGRPAMLAAIAARHQRPLVFVNLVGGNDDLIFDGTSAVFSSRGEIVARAGSFSEDVQVFDLHADSSALSVLETTDAAAALDALVLGTRDYARKCGFTRAVLGLSGGIDSSLVAAVAAMALGPKNVLGVAMPTRYSSAHSLVDARTLAETLGVEYRVISIEPIFERYLDVLSPELHALGEAGARDTTFENIQARIRGNTLMAISNRLGHLLLTTGNKSEVAVGYCTLYGDMAGGLAVISDLPKTFVYDVSREVNLRAGRELIPQHVFDKAPSAELKPDQRDQDTLPPYPVLDAVLERLVEQGLSIEEVVAAGFERPLVVRVANMVRHNEYKRRQMPPGLIVTGKAFGPGRRYPIAQRYDR